jgi:hypothetical protein
MMTAGGRFHVFACPAQYRDATDIRQLPVEYQQVKGFAAPLAQQVFTAFEAMQGPGLFRDTGDLSQCLFHPPQFSGFVIQYCDTHVEGPFF